MRDIYLIDFENVASEGLSGITFLSEDDQVIIFYSNNSNRLSMKMHILIGKSVCKLSYFEVTVGGKNALDHQISTWLGYLVGTNAAERNYYIVSRDMGYKHVAHFWANSTMKPCVRCIDAIKTAGRMERRHKEVTVALQAPVEPKRLPETTEEPIVKLTETASEPELQAEPAPERAEVEVAEISAAAEVLPESEATAVQMEEIAPAVEAVPAGQPEIVAEASAEEATEGQPAKSRRGRVGRGRTRSRSRNVQPKESALVEAAEEPAEPLQTEAAAAPQTEEQENAGEKPQHKARAARGQNRNSRRSMGQEKPAEEGKSVKGLEQLPVLIAPYPALQEEHLRSLIGSNKKQVLCNTLRKQLGQENGLALYNEIKKIAWR